MHFSWCHVECPAPGGLAAPNEPLLAPAAPASRAVPAGHLPEQADVQGAGQVAPPTVDVAAAAKLLQVSWRRVVCRGGPVAADVAMSEDVPHLQPNMKFCLQSNERATRIVNENSPQLLA